MEVVDIRNGPIGIRNPWGYWVGADEGPGQVDGVVYMSEEDFRDIFVYSASTEYTGWW